MDRKKRKNYSREHIQAALEAIKSKTLSINKASKVFNVPKSTLIDTMKQRYKNPGIPGGSTVLTSEEQQILVRWILEMGDLGFPVTKIQLLESVTKLMQNLGRTNPFKNNRSEEKWYNFLSRHPMIPTGTRTYNRCRLKVI